VRLVSGIILGNFVFGMSAFALFRITNHDPHAPASISFEIGSIIYGTLFALLAGYVAGFIGGRRDLMAAKVVALLVGLVAIVSMIAAGVGWSPMAALFLMAPCVIIGGYLRLKRTPPET
jgi:hypothetical protein